jgi:ATP adenylyltransferase/5',5'''-P-1,P-4-tetraphosphate phosphorylase II
MMRVHEQLGRMGLLGVAGDEPGKGTGIGGPQYRRVSPAAEVDTPVTVPALPFVHSFVRLGSDATAPGCAASRPFDLHSAMLRHTGIEAAEPSRPKRQSMPYNFLLTRRWMLLVPRTRECFEDISLNALAFAGSLFVRDQAQYARLG